MARLRPAASASRQESQVFPISFFKKKLHSGKAETQEGEILLAPSGPFWDLLAVFSAHSFGVHWGKRDTPRWCGERFRTHGYVFTGANKNDCLLLVKAS